MDSPTKLQLNNVDDRPPENSSHTILLHDDNDDGEITITLLGLVKIIPKNVFLLNNQQANLAVQQSNPGWEHPRNSVKNIIDGELKNKMVSEAHWIDL